MSRAADLLLLTQLLAWLARRDELLAHQMVLDFEQLPIGSAEMLIWAMLDRDGQEILATRAAQGDAAAREQLMRLTHFFSSGWPMQGSSWPPEPLFRRATLRDCQLLVAVLRPGPWRSI